MNDKGNNFLITVLSSVISVKGLILASILVLPAITYFYVTQGSNNFIKLEVIGHEGHQIPDFSFIIDIYY